MYPTMAAHMLPMLKVPLAMDTLIIATQRTISTTRGDLRTTLTKPATEDPKTTPHRALLTVPPQDPPLSKLTLPIMPTIETRKSLADRVGGFEGLKLFGLSKMS